MKLILKIWLILFGVLFIFTAKNSYYRNSANLSTIISRHPWSGEFKATNDRLGIVAVKFNPWPEGVSDPVRFKIKAKGSADWYYQSEYYNASNTPTFFPFGFPIIDDSKGKIYQLEIESPVEVSTPYFLTKYSFPLSYLKQNQSQIPGFIIEKILSWFWALTAVPLINYLLILLLGLLLTIKQTIIKPMQNWLTCLWLLLIGSVVSQAIFGSSEKLEWGIYMFFGATLIPLAFVIKRISLVKFQPIYALTLAVLIFWLSLTKNLEANQLQLLSLALLVPQALLVNLVGILAVISFFPNIYYPGLIILLTLSIYFIYWRVKVRLPIKLKLPVWLAVFLLLIMIFYLVQKPIPYHHYSFYLGPAFDVIKGKSLLGDTPSQYGYLSIQFLAAILRRVGFSLANFHLLNLVSFAVYYLIASLILLKQVKNKWLGFLAAIIFITLQTVFSDFNYALLPSTGPWRFGIGLLILWGLTYLPSTAGFILGSILSAIALFWSAETAIYVVPAWLATCLFFKNPKSKLFIFGITSLTIFLVIVYKEFLIFHTLPRISDYFEYAFAFKDGSGALPIPLYGNYYLIICITILGIVAVVKKFSPLLVFITIHNLAIFSYFISRSHENNIVNLAGFFLIELILSIKVLRPKKIYALPLVLFLVLYAVSLVNQIKSLHQEFPTKTIPSLPVLATAINQYQFQSQPVVLLSKDNDTRLLIESNIKNELPLNPALMTNWLGRTWLDKYVYPAIDRLPIGTVVIMEPEASQNFLRPAVERLRSRFQLQPIGIIHPQELEIYQIIEAI